MIELQGKYNTAKVFTDNVEETAVGQIIELCNQEFIEKSQIRIMPDCHAGAGCTIGTTMTIQDKIVPNLVGVDIGCGMAVARINTLGKDIDFDKLDDIIRKYVPSGFSVRDKQHFYSQMIPFNEVRAPIGIQRAEKSIGTLGGGNHFIELNEGCFGDIYLVVHSGSRNLGKQIAEYYQKLAYERLMDTENEKDRVIEQLKAQGREPEIHEALRGIKSPKIRKELAYLEGNGFNDYMHDMKIAQKFAFYNRFAMITEICDRMEWMWLEKFDTIHNYIDMENMILRKGAISAQKDEKVIIPMNMRDGSIIALGLGNPDWNFSAPHGAGRIMSRSQAKKKVSLAEFQSTMKDIWTTSVSNSTLDEAPMVYKPMDEIIRNVKDTIDIADTIKPLYNFKASD